MFYHLLYYYHYFTGSIEIENNDSFKCLRMSKGELISLCKESTTVVWNIRQMEQRKSNTPEVSIKFSGDTLAYGKSDQGLIGIGDETGAVKIYDVQQSASTSNFKLTHSGCQSLSFTNDDRYVACGSSTGRVTLFDTRASPRPVCKYSPSHSKLSIPVDSLEVTPDGLYIVAGSSKDDDLSVWDIRQGRTVKNFRVGSRITSLDSNPFKRHICVGSVAGPRVLNISTFRFIPEFSKPGSKDSLGSCEVIQNRPCARYSGDGNYLVGIKGSEVRQLEWFPFVNTVETLSAPWDVGTLTDCSFVPGVNTMVACAVKKNALSIWLTPIASFKKNRNSMGTLRRTDIDSYLYSNEEPAVAATAAVTIHTIDEPDNVVTAIKKKYPAVAKKTTEEPVKKIKEAEEGEITKPTQPPSQLQISKKIFQTQNSEKDKFNTEQKQFHSQIVTFKEPQSTQQQQQLPPPPPLKKPRQNLPKPQHVETEIPNEESALISSIDSHYDKTMQTLQERLSQLEEMQRLWAEDPSSAAEAAVSTQDNVVSMSLLKALCAKPEWLTLRLASLLGPAVLRLIRTNEYDMQFAAVSLVEVVITKFGKLISSVVHRQKMSAKQENSNVEDRVRYCCELYELFVTVQQSLPIPQKRRSGQHHHQQQRQQLMQQGQTDKLIAKSLKLSVKITDLF